MNCRDADRCRQGAGHGNSKESRQVHVTKCAAWQVTTQAENNEGKGACDRYRVSAGR